MKKFDKWKWWMRFKKSILTFDTFGVLDPSGDEKRNTLIMRGFKLVGIKRGRFGIIAIRIWNKDKDIIHEYHEYGN